MKKPSLMLRQLSIRLRMWGAIAMVLALFAFVGAVGLLGGGKVKSLSDHFIDNSALEAETLDAAKAHLAKVRLLEKQMVIDYEDGAQVLKLREAWQLEIVATNKALEGLIEGEEAAEKSFAREAVERLAAYAERSKTVLDNIQNGGYDNARTADRMLARQGRGGRRRKCPGQRRRAVESQGRRHAQRGRRSHPEGDCHLHRRLGRGGGGGVAADDPELTLDHRAHRLRGLGRRGHCQRRPHDADTHGRP